MERNLEKLANQKYDLLVIGGGIYGALAIWDAALRGLSVALIERGDFGSATSQNSLKIIHGGLRYLQDGNLSRIRNMARERTIWMQIAPHLVHPLTCLMPTRHKLTRSRLALGVAMKANDLLSLDRNRRGDPEKHLPNGKIISQQELAGLLSGYDASNSTGAAVWHDAQVYNTERLLLDFILSAVNYGAEVANYTAAIGFLRKGDCIIGARVRDVFSGQRFEIHSRVVLNCTGAWADNLLQDINIQSDHATSVALNIIVDKIWSDVAAGLPSQPLDGRKSQILFFVPWHNKTIIGTWHIPWIDAPDDFKINDGILQDFIDDINTINIQDEFSLDDIQHVNWGFLPVNREDAGKKRVKLTRDGILIDHQKKDKLEGLISMLGVKYTTARSVAESAIDMVVTKLGKNSNKCQTHKTQIVGGRINDFEMFLNQTQTEASPIIDKETIKHLVYTYGSNTQNIIHSINKQPELEKRIDPNSPVTQAEIVHAIHNEMTMTLNDLIQRRTELGAAGLPSVPVLQKCAQILGSALDWNFERQKQEIEAVFQAYPFKSLEGVQK